MLYSENIHLLSLQFRRPANYPDVFPYIVPAIKTLEEVHFEAPVTFFVGENGSGKSTLLEALACAAGSTTVGSESVQTDRSLAAVRSFAKNLRLAWSKKTGKGFFLRSEDFIGYAKKMVQTREELESDLRQVEVDYAQRSETARAFARLAYLNELGAMKREYGGRDLEAHSHGESFLALFKARFMEGGLYLLDEPETPLSAMRQLSFLVLLNSMVKQKAQFIIATHSPIIMAFPGAVILNFDGQRVERMAFEDVEHVRVTKSFLDNPGRFLGYLFEE